MSKGVWHTMSIVQLPNAFAPSSLQVLKRFPITENVAISNGYETPLTSKLFQQCKDHWEDTNPRANLTPFWLPTQKQLVENTLQNCNLSANPQHRVFWKSIWTGQWKPPNFGFPKQTENFQKKKKAELLKKNAFLNQVGPARKSIWRLLISNAVEFLEWTKPTLPRSKAVGTSENNIWIARMNLTPTGIPTEFDESENRCKIRRNVFLEFTKQFQLIFANLNVKPLMFQGSVRSPREVRKSQTCMWGACNFQRCSKKLLQSQPNAQQLEKWLIIRSPRALLKHWSFKTEMHGWCDSFKHSERCRPEQSGHKNVKTLQRRLRHHNQFPTSTWICTLFPPMSSTISPSQKMLQSQHDCGTPLTSKLCQVLQQWNEHTNKTQNPRAHKTLPIRESPKSGKKQISSEMLPSSRLWEIWAEL